MYLPIGLYLNTINLRRTPRVVLVHKLPYSDRSTCASFGTSWDMYEHNFAVECTMLLMLSLSGYLGKHEQSLSFLLFFLSNFFVRAITSFQSPVQKVTDRKRRSRAVCISRSQLTLSLSLRARPAAKSLGRHTPPTPRGRDTGTTKEKTHVN